MIDRTDGRTLRSGFLKNASLRPDAPAVAVRGTTRTYAQLEETARRWAQAITDSLGRPAHRVGVFGYRSEVSYTGALAALFSGAAFVPLNPTFPQNKTASMVRQAGLDAIIIDKTCSPQAESVLAGLAPCPLVLTPELDSPHFAGVDGVIFDRTALEHTRPLDQLPPVLPDDIAYLLFTSGSTGEPKGVPVAHGNVTHFLDVVAARYGVTPDDRLSQTFDQTFDLSVFDLFLAWECGACVVSLSTVELLAPAKIMAQRGITLWFSVPSVAAQLRKRDLLKPGVFPGLRWSLFCGEPLPDASARAWQEAAPNSVVENLYGPTELTIACFVYRWDPLASPPDCVNGVVPIGRPLAGLGAMIVDDQLKTVAEEEAGELCVCGPQTTPGYWKDPARTAERFVMLPSDSPVRYRFYRTGDRVRRLPGGDYIYLGRTDHQIKVLGHRVELGEIEAALQRDTGVVQAVAIGWPIQDGSAAGIVAFVSGSGISTEHLREEARRQLPAYAVPSAIHFVKEMPLNANGKVDRIVLRKRLETPAESS
jgi:amino acid adenylation domain-containing protein